MISTAFAAHMLKFTVGITGNLRIKSMTRGWPGVVRAIVVAVLILVWSFGFPSYQMRMLER